MTTYGDSTQVHLAPNGRIWIAASGTVLPTNVTTAMGTVSPNYKELGYVSDAGVSVTPGYDTNGIKAWQTAVDVKTVLTGVSLNCKFSALQVTQDATANYFFGGAWANSGGIGKLDFNSAPNLAERVLVIEWSDDASYAYRLCFGRGVLTDRDAMTLVRTEATAFGVTFEALDNSGSLGNLLSNNPALIPAT